MSETTEIFMGTKAFIALRPDIFGHEREHVTVEWIGSFPEWKDLLRKIQDWEAVFGLERNPNNISQVPVPLRVQVNGYANWVSKDYHHVALVGFPGHQDLSFSKNWHITLETSDHPIPSYTIDRDADAFRYDDCTELWIGYKNQNNDKCWIKAADAWTLVETRNQECQPKSALAVSQNYR